MVLVTSIWFIKTLEELYRQEKYVSLVPDVFVFDLYCSNHKLPIEIGRGGNLPIEKKKKTKRLYAKCNV